jgi:hypothetical protein
MMAREGSYFWTAAEPASRYQGWFLVLGEGRLIKVIDDIRPRDRKRVEKLSCGPVSVEKTGPEFRESFYLPGRQTIVYELDKFSPVEIFFDVKDPYDSPELGRNYRVWKEDGAIIVNFNQDGGKLPEIFAVILGDFGIIEIKEEWAERTYRMDQVRRDLPCERWVFEPAEISASRILIAAATTKEKAMSGAREAWRDFAKPKNLKPAGTNETLPDGYNSSEAEAAKQCAAGALDMLRVKKSGKKALRAGLPWFFQVWRRDEAVSLGGLSIFDSKAAQEILWHQLDELAASGHKFGESADAIGWLFLRAGELIRAGKIDTAGKQKIFTALKRSIEKLLAEDTKNLLAVSGPKMTWMDSLGRAGAAIEIQALRLNMYRVAGVIAPDEEQKTNYRELEELTASAVRRAFFANGKLSDLVDPDGGWTDGRGRPNIFLAAYVYPQLLEENEWRAVFDKALPALWLDWGGLSTLDKSDPEFREKDTGVDPAAYHNGDSWFWVNNLAAVVLSRFGRDKYGAFIEKIFEASKNDILWNGAIGCASEISPAGGYVPAGCANQAWSDATFLELYRELKR